MTCACIYVRGTYKQGDSVVYDGKRNFPVCADDTRNCVRCGKAIAPGEPHEHWAGRLATKHIQAPEGYLLHRQEFSTCKGCKDLEKAFFCSYSSVSFGPAFFRRIAWELMYGVNSAICCLDGLSPEAIEVFDRCILPEMERWA